MLIDVEAEKIRTLLSFCDSDSYEEVSYVPTPSISNFTLDFCVSVTALSSKPAPAEMIFGVV